MTNYNEIGENRERAPFSDGHAPESDASPAEFGPGRSGPLPSAADLFLSPHTDDICFSLGELVRTRGAGTVLTVFSRSFYLASPPAGRRSSADEVTPIRRAEEAAFAAACGVDIECLGLEEASLRRCAPFALDGLESHSRRIEPILMEHLSHSGHPPADTARPWLFCPSGIGGHIDHVAILAAVARNLDTLQKIYRLCFYEDLHYASNILARSLGLNRLSGFLSNRTLVRRHWVIADGGAAKLELVRIYASQFASPPASIEQFSPAIYTGAVPHEAVWIPQERKR